MENYLWIGFIGAVLALLFAAIQRKKVMSYSEGNATMQKIAQSIREGANAYLKHQYSTVAKVFAVVFVVLVIIAFASGGEMLSKFTPFAFLTGGIWSMLAGLIGMKIATNSNARTAQAASESLNRGLRVAFSSGAVMGFTVVGLGMLDISIWLMILHFGAGITDPVQLGNIIVMNGIGASFMALFARVGGGIYTKAADVGADLVGKVEAGIPEDDPRNPATIADNVGDNVGDVAGLGSDLLESYMGAISSAVILAFSLFTTNNVLSAGSITTAMLQSMFVYPVAFCSLGLIACVLGIGWLLMRKNVSDHPHKELNGATYVSAGLTLVLGLILTFIMFRGVDLSVVGFKLGWFSPWVGAALGLIAGVVIGMIAEYYTSADYKPTQAVAQASKEGPALTITQGLALGMKSCMAPCIILGLAIVLAHYVAGVYGVAMSAVGMLSFVAATVSVDTYGPISDNAGGIAEMSALDPEVREITDTLDSVGNTTAAIGKGFAIGSGSLAALALMISYLYAYNDPTTDLVLNIINPLTLAGAIIGAALPFLFSGMLIEAVAKAARKMVEEVRRQFRTIPGILEGKARPDYKTCISISTKGAIGEMKVPALLAIVVPVVCGFIAGPEFVGGLIIGSTLCSIMIAIFTGNAGGAWDNGKKHIEQGGVEGAAKGDEVHAAAVVGDTVGDPLKDTVGPCLDIFIKIMSTVSLVAVAVFSKYNLFGLFF